MPRKPERPPVSKIYPYSTRETIKHLVNPLSAFSRCESAAFVRQALTHALKRDLTPINPNYELIPSLTMISLCDGLRHSKDKFIAIQDEKHINQAAIIAATNLRNARVLFEQADSVSEEVRPIPFYYGALSFFEFITKVIVRRERVGNPGHGMSISCESDGWNFNEDWTKKCWVNFSQSGSGDFPFIVDALTLGGWPSFFSSFRFHRDHKQAPWEPRKNPAPLLKPGKMSLDFLCHFDRQKYVADNPNVEGWLQGSNSDMVWTMTTLLMDFVIVFIASNLARYYIPAWQGIVAAEKSSIYNDIREAYSGVSEALPYYFEGEYPFQYSFGTRIPQ